MFIDGMLEAADEATFFIDGMEDYDCRRWDGSPGSEGINLINRTVGDGTDGTVTALKLTAVPSLYRQKMRVGFGIEIGKTFVRTDSVGFKEVLDKALYLSDHQLHEWNQGNRYIWFWHQAHPEGPVMNGEPQPPIIAPTWWLPEGSTQFPPTSFKLIVLCAINLPMLQLLKHFARH